VVGLRGRAIGLWQDVQREWSLDPAGLELLRLACEAMSRADECAEVVNREGATYRDKWGQPRAHPSALLERDYRGQAARHLAALGVSLEST
jgi:P27 family predicted phage terminase small subunit